MTDFRNKKDCALIIILFGIGFDIIFAILSLSFSYTADFSCASKYDGISFNFHIWMKVYGLIGITYSIISLCSFLTLLQTNYSYEIYIYIINFPYSLFMFIWYIIGSILFFKTIVGNCTGEDFGQFACFLFTVNALYNIFSGPNLVRILHIIIKMIREKKTTVIHI